MVHINLQFSLHFPLLGKEKIPLGIGYIFESKFPLVVRMGLAARACGSGNGQSPSNSAVQYIVPCLLF